MTEFISYIPSRIKNAAVNGHVAGAEDIIDDETGLTLDKVAGSALEAKEYTSGSDNGMGRVVLRKNLVEEVNTLTQNMINKSNTIYVIQYDFTLGEDITIPANCILEFEGGSIKGSHLYTNGCIIKGDYKQSQIYFDGNFVVSKDERLESVALSNCRIVEDGEELASALSSNEYDTILLKGDRFIMPTEIDNISFEGSILPYQNYKPTIYGSGTLVKAFEKTSNMFSANLGRNLNSKLFNAFDSNGNEIHINTLSDVLNTDIGYISGTITYSGNVATIPMDTNVKAILANKSGDFFRNATLVVHSWYMTYVFDSFYTDANNIYATYTGSFSLDNINYDKTAYGFKNTRFNIFNLPIGENNLYIDGDNVCFSENIYDSVLICDYNTRISCTNVSFYNLSFKGNILFSASSCVFKNCSFSSMSSTPLEIEDGTKVKNCTFENLRGGAVHTTISSNCIIDSCNFSNIGDIVLRTIVVLGRLNTIIRKCHFKNFTYIAVDAKETTVVEDCIIESPDYSKNTEKYSILDGGAIYVIGFYNNLIIRRNVIRHYKSRGNKDYRGMFLDDGASGVNFYENVVYDTDAYAIDSRYVADSQNRNNINNHFNNNVCIGNIRIEGNSDISTTESTPEVSNNVFSKTHSIAFNKIPQKVNTTRFHYLNVDENDIVHGEGARNNENWGAPISYTDFINMYFVSTNHTPLPKSYCHLATTANASERYFIRTLIPAFQDGKRDNCFYIKSHIVLKNNTYNEVIDIPMLYFDVATNNVLTGKPSSSIVVASPSNKCYMEYIRGYMVAGGVTLDFQFRLLNNVDNTSLAFVVDEITSDGITQQGAATRSPYPTTASLVTGASSANILITFAAPE